MKFRLGFLLLFIVAAGLCPALSRGQAKDAQAYKWYEQGRQDLNRQDYPKAIEAFSQTIRQQANFAEAYLYRGLARFEQREYEQAIDDFTRALDFKSSLNEA